MFIHDAAYSPSDRARDTDGGHRGTGRCHSPLPRAHPGRAGGVHAWHLGIAWQRAIVAKLEGGRRSFLTVDELLALCVVLEIIAVDLLVPKDLDADQPYRIVPNATARAGMLASSYAGRRSCYSGPTPSRCRSRCGWEVRFASASRDDLVDPIQWMPTDRAERVANRLLQPRGRTRREEDQ